MADVDLEVAVKNSGITAAIANLENLRSKGLSTAAGLDKVASSATSMATAIEKATRTGSSANNLSGVNKAAESATGALATLEAEYGRLAQAQVRQTAAQRLANNLGSNPQATLATVQLLTQAANATILGDAAQVAAEKQDLLAAANDRVTATAALNDAVWGTYSKNLTEAGLATDRLTQAELAYTAAQRATTQATAAAATSRVPAGQVGAGTFRAATAGEQQQLNAAIRQEAVALEEVTVATNQLTLAQDRESAAAKTAATANDDTSGFGYFKYLIIAGAADRAAQSILGIAGAAVTASAAQDRAFADVNRTFDGTASELDNLRTKLTELSTVTPFSFVDLSQIAALGNQLGVAAADIETFTTTVANFSLVSGQSAEEAATEFGKIGNLTGLPASQFNNLGSSIEYVARTTAATESTIASTSKEIAALASGAGFSADAIVGLSGALSSLSIPPERARGALSLYFGALNNAVATGGPKLEAFATLTGISADNIAKLVANNQGQQVFTSFISGLSQLNSVAKTTALKELGLSTIRVDQTMRALSQNVPLLTSSLQGASSAFDQNTELARQAAIIQNTLTTKYAEFQHAVQNAAAAVGGAFGPALILALNAVTGLLVGIEHFIKTPVGSVLAGIALAVSVVVAAMLALVGGFALVTAAQKVVPWAITALGAKEANSSIVQFIAGLVGLNVTLVETDAGLVVTTGSLRGVETASVAASNGFKVMRGALISTGIGIAAVVIGTLVESLIEASNAAKDATQQAQEFFGQDVSGNLSTALQKDQAVFVQTGERIGTIATKVKVSSTNTDSWVSSMENATNAQADLGDNTQKTTQKIVDQTASYGPNAQAALASLLANTKKFQDLFKDTVSNNALSNLGGSPAKLADAILGSSDPVHAGKKYVEDLTASIAKQVGLSKEITAAALSQLGAGASTNDISKGLNINPVAAKKSLDTLAAIAPAFKLYQDAASSSSTEIAKGATKAAAFTAAQNALKLATVGAGDGFEGATSSLSDYQDAIQTGLSSVLTFSSILQTVTANATNKKGILDPKLVNADGFNTELKKASDGAVTFFNGIQQLASDGSTSFATQLASLGPAAQGVLSSALNASPETRAQLEENARFAAFLASDAFKTAFSKDMASSNDAYARILTGGGTLDTVKGFIDAQVKGTADEWEKQWDAQHPNLPLNLTFQQPSDAQIQQFQDQLNGKITVKAVVIPVPSGGIPGKAAANQFTDTATGNSITLPATLDGKALSASLAYWEKNENTTPALLASTLNSGDLDASLAQWIATHGPIKLDAQVNVSPTTSSLNELARRVLAASGGARSAQREGGLQDWANWNSHPGFANGGLFAGPGTGTSDSILARVSNGEYINTADIVNYWGVDTFDALSRKMIPASFANMLGGAAGSGSNGPSHVAHVQVVQNNPLTRDPLAQLRLDSENMAAGIWGSN